MRAGFSWDRPSPENDPLPMKAETHHYLRSSLARLQHELRLVQETRQRVASDPCLDAQRRAIYVSYYDAIIRWLLEGVERLEVALSCVDGSP